jgi:tetratricopeptide (TPR) repeat protein
LFQAAKLIDESPDHLRALLYYDRGLEVRDDPGMRLRYAFLLSEKRETSRDAAREFETLLKRDPRSASAHLGAARAYSWAGDSGRAFEHARRALQLDPDLVPAAQLYGELHEGRETRVGGEATFLFQTGGDYGLTGFTIGPRLDFFPAGSLVATAQAGTGYYKHRSDEAFGPEGLLGLKYLNPYGKSLEGSIGYLGLPHLRHPLKFFARYGGDEGPRWRWFGFERDYVYDSFQSLAGKTIGGQRYGEARSNLFFGDAGMRWGRFSGSVRPFLGWIETEGLDTNPKTGGAASIQFTVLKASASTVAVEYEGQISHYGQDDSGFAPSTAEPLPGGYFSPDRFIENVPQLVLYMRGSRDSQLRLAGGPSFQYVRLHNQTHGTNQTGRQADLSGQWRFAGDWQSSVRVEYKDISTFYQRLSINAVVQRLF